MRIPTIAQVLVLLTTLVGASGCAHVDRDYHQWRERHRYDRDYRDYRDDRRHREWHDDD